MEISLSGEGSGWQLQFIEAINHLLVNDFNRLVALLYRMDVSEAKIRSQLASRPDTDAARVIAALVIERELRKQQSRRESRRDDINSISDEERW